MTSPTHPHRALPLDTARETSVCHPYRLCPQNSTPGQERLAAVVAGNDNGDDDDDDDGILVHFASVSRTGRRVQTFPETRASTWRIKLPSCNPVFGS